MDETPVPDTQLVDQRHAWLLEQVAAHRRVMTNQAAEQLQVSVDTIRRDLRSLHSQGLVRRVHGGAVPVARLPNSFAERASEDSMALARRVVELFEPGQVIGLDGGTTCVDIASLIPTTLDISIITNNPAAAVALAGHPVVKVTLLGGHVDLTWMTTTGADTVDGWRNYHLDIGVLGLCGIDAAVGATTNSEHEVATKRALIAASADVVVPVHHDKVGVRAPFVIAGLDALDVIISDTDLPKDISRALSGHASHMVVIQ